MKKSKLISWWFLVLFSLLLSLASCTSSPSASQPAGTDESRLSSRIREKLDRIRGRLKNKQQNKAPRYKVAYSPALERDVNNLAGIEIPTEAVRQNGQARADAIRRRTERRKKIEEFLRDHPDEETPDYDISLKILKKLREANPDKQISGNWKEMLAYLPEFDWRDFEVKAPVQNQQECNSCWAFATISALNCSIDIQSSYAYSFNYVKKEDATETTVTHDEVSWYEPSTQVLLNCIGKKKGSCGGGWHGSAFNLLVGKGLPNWSEEYIAKVDDCVDSDEKIKALAWDYVNKPPDKTPSPELLKEALLEHGPLVVLVHINEDFLAYDGGIYDDDDNTTVNHAVLLMGWDDAEQAWLIQNSWGQEWGEDGMMWIAWNSNNIGQYAAWIEASFFD